jgi:hypothetical protein
MPTVRLDLGGDAPVKARRQPARYQKIFGLAIVSHRKREGTLSVLFDYVFWKTKIASFENIAVAAHKRDLQASSARQSPETTSKVVSRRLRRRRLIGLKTQHGCRLVPAKPATSRN